MKKTTKRLCLVFSIGSLLALAALVLCILLRGPSVYAYYNRYELMCTVLSALPFIELLIFLILEPTLKYINKRWLLFGIFFTYVVQFFVFLFMGLENPVFLNSVMNDLDFLIEIIAIIRLILLVAIPFLNRWIVKGYSIFMMGVTVFSFISLIDIASYMDTYFYSYATAIFADLLFHVALFFFADVMTEENDLFTTSEFFWKWLGPKDELLDDFEENTPTERSLAVDYKLVSLYAAAHEKSEFVQTALFFSRLAQEKFWDTENRYYTPEECLLHLGQLKALAEEINQQWDGYISDDFLYIIGQLLTDPQVYTWKADITAVAMLFAGQSASAWFQTISQHTDYHENRLAASAPSEEPLEYPTEEPSEQTDEQPQE